MWDVRFITWTSQDKKYGELQRLELHSKKNDLLRFFRKNLLGQTVDPLLSAETLLMASPAKTAIPTRASDYGFFFSATAVLSWTHNFVRIVLDILKTGAHQGPANGRNVAQMDVGQGRKLQMRRLWQLSLEKLSIVTDWMSLREESLARTCSVKCKDYKDYQDGNRGIHGEMC